MQMVINQLVYYEQRVRIIYNNVQDQSVLPTEQHHVFNVQQELVQIQQEQVVSHDQLVIIKYNFQVESVRQVQDHVLIEQRGHTKTDCIQVVLHAQQVINTFQTLQVRQALQGQHLAHYDQLVLMQPLISQPVFNALLVRNETLINVIGWISISDGVTSCTECTAGTHSNTAQIS